MKVESIPHGGVIGDQRCRTVLMCMLAAIRVRHAGSAARPGPPLELPHSPDGVVLASYHPGAHELQGWLHHPVGSTA